LLSKINPDDNSHVDKAQAILGFSNHDQKKKIFF